MNSNRRNPPPFTNDVQLEQSLNNISWTQPIPNNVFLPGFPRAKLNDVHGIMEHLRKELWCERQEMMAKHLWLMSTHLSTNITPLHRQSLRGREIIVMEDPGLHLVWRHNQIFVKPLPRYLMSFVFWDQYLLPGAKALPETEREELVRAAIGLLRSYYYLVQYESDFHKAQDTGLLPKHVTWEQFCKFSEAFHYIPNEMVSKRYEYGELRLSRLNFWAVPLLRKMAYQDQGLQYSDYFAPYFGPLLFVFGVFSVLLSAMQVGLAAETLDVYGWSVFVNLSRWFAVLSIVLSIIPVTGLLCVFIIKFVDEWVYALKRQFFSRRSSGTTSVKDVS